MIGFVRSMSIDCWLLKFRPRLIVLLQIKNKISTTLASVVGRLNATINFFK